MSIIKNGDTLQEAPSYRPEIGNEIWDGFISLDPLYPTGEDWHRFSQLVNDEYSANLPANASTTSVNVPLAAGNAEAILSVTSQWASWRLKSSTFQWFIPPSVKAKIKENIKASGTGPLWGESTTDRYISPHKGPVKPERISMVWRHHKFKLLWK